MNEMSLGAIATASMVAALFFLRFWKSTRDRFFLFFAMSFFIEGVNRALLGLMAGLREEAPAYYLIRLVAYSLILFAILDKNKLGRKGK
jgi:O-antigen/teichoic acid export membrane protein